VGNDGGVIDYHVHLWRHTASQSLQANVEHLADYCAHAARLGVTELAVPEHSSRFPQVDALVRGWWDQAPNPARRAENEEAQQQWPAAAWSRSGATTPGQWRNSPVSTPTVPPPRLRLPQLARQVSRADSARSGSCLWGGVRQTPLPGGIAVR
jgi:hypothetical protein